MDGAALDRWRLNRRRRAIDWNAVTRTRPGVRILDLETTSLRVRVQGDARRAVLFLCDPPNLVENYDDVFSCFGSDVTVACVEQPGFGFSLPKRSYDFTLPGHSEALASGLDCLNYESCTLVAPCVSSYSAMRTAREHPELVDQLVLMQATDLEEERRWILRTAEKFVRRVTGIPRLGGYMAQIPYLGQALAAVTETRFGERTYPSVIYDAPNRSELVENLIQASNDAFAAGACNCMPNLIQSYFRCTEEDFAGAQQPTLILWGDSDPSHAQSTRDALCAYVSSARVDLIPDTGHHLEIENPKAVCDRIQGFMDSARASSGQT